MSETGRETLRCRLTERLHRESRTEVKSMATTQKTNREIAKQQYEAFNRGDLEECLAGLTEDITWTSPEGDPLASGTVHGPEAVMKEIWEPVMEHVDRFEVVIDRLLDDGDTVVMEGAHRATMPDGERIEVPAVHLIDMEDGKARQFTTYEDTALLEEFMEK